MSPAITELKRQKRQIIEQYAQACNWSALFQCISTLSLIFIKLRCFVLLHDCGHGSLFKTSPTNKAFGFLFGVITGMPQYVWSQHHKYHHATNGNWALYRGPLDSLTVGEFDALGADGRKKYQKLRSMQMAPLGGLMYMIINPRINWIKGNFGVLLHLARHRSLQNFQPRYWADWVQYQHQTLNNFFLLSIWVAMSFAIGPGPFFAIYLISGGLAGALGLILFTVQHNFEHAYATCEDGWDYDQAAIHGTSYLDLPAWLNWVTGSIGYHHIHHLSASIPNYHLRACHDENAWLFSEVQRLTLRDLRQSLRCLLWDCDEKRIISFDEYHRRRDNNKFA